MDEVTAKTLLGPSVCPDNSLRCSDSYVCWPSNGDKSFVVLDGEFDADELEAITWWMRNKNG